MPIRVKVYRAVGGGVILWKGNASLHFGREHVRWIIVGDRSLGLLLPNRHKPIADPFHEGPLSDEDLQRVRGGTYANW